ncbi:MAG: DUF1987 domain-containing protein [Bacteroidia bacterium]|nr:DUF1987 domain-containing protein [Bacteroidia bacterium]MDW8157878.1 DUF1987 domain-containing protein [Bacteroidia bacterium]
MVQDIEDYKAPTKDTPEMIINKATGDLILRGNSYPSDSVAFYSHIIDWYRTQIETGKYPNINIDFYFDYINTSSTKLIIQLLDLLENQIAAGRTCVVRWHYLPEDTNMRDIGEDLKNFVNIPFELVERED